MSKFAVPVAVQDTRVLPVLLDDLKENLRVEHNDQDRLLLNKIRTATDEAEAFLGAAIISQSFDLILDAPPESNAAIELINPPIRSVTSISYYDGDGVLQALDSANYALVQALAIPEIRLVNGASWPSTQARPDAFTVRYVAGYADKPSEVPPAIAEAIVLRASTRYAMAEESGSGTVVWNMSDRLAFRALLEPYRNVYL